MKVTLYMAQTANGYIARKNDETPWSSIEWRKFTKVLRKASNCVMGRRTFEVCLAAGVFPYKNCLNVVMTRRKIKNKWGRNVLFTDKTPRAVLNMMKNKGFKEVVVAGGATLNASFMKAGLINEIVLDVEPNLFAEGIRLFEGKNFEAKLKLLEVKKFSPNELTLRYKVKS